MTASERGGMYDPLAATEAASRERAKILKSIVAASKARRKEDGRWWGGKVEHLLEILSRPSHDLESRIH
jgi:hypothetical protein